MKQPDYKARQEYLDTIHDNPIVVQIPLTRKKVKIRGIKPYTIERLTKVWLDRDAVITSNSADTLKSMAIEPYFTIKQAALFSLNDYWKIRLFYRWRCFWWGKVKGYTEKQMLPIIEAGKKKIQLTAHWINMASTVDMRSDWIKMTEKEAEQYRAELLSVARQHSSKSTPNTAEQDDSFSDL